jgi:hypothetical protein
MTMHLRERHQQVMHIRAKHAKAYTNVMVFKDKAYKGNAYMVKTCERKEAKRQCITGQCI